MLADRENPDYRNSIKESISAVEGACQAFTGKAGATLGECTKILGQKGIHPAFKDALSKLYGWTNDANGIRHALTDDEAEPSLAYAKFKLVTCSAFVNFLRTWAAENNHPIPGGQ